MSEESEMLGTAAPFAATMDALSATSSFTATDYKALVCIFLSGGNDNYNTMPPYDPASYELYRKARPALAHPYDSLAATALTPAVPLPNGRQYALHPSLLPIHPLFAQGKLAMLLNVGTLVAPLTKAQYLNKTVKAPPKLFSHNDQQSYFQASSPEGSANGWGGRIGDMVQSANQTSTFTCINAGGTNDFLMGKSVSPYKVGSAGATPLLGNNTVLFGRASGMNAVHSFARGGSSHVMGNEYSKVFTRAHDAYGAFSNALTTSPIENFAGFPVSPLGDQLKTVARMISIAQELGVKRQVFFVNFGSFDHHSNLLSSHVSKLTILADAMKAFYDQTVTMGVADKVTTFTGSDFGRTLSPTGTGADHGWGSNHFIMGGAVKGNRIFGTPPTIGNDTIDAVGRGRLIPTTSVDQYAATFASWFGVTDTDMPTVMPNITKWDQSKWNVGFMNPG